MPSFRVDTKPAFLHDLVLLPKSVQKRAIAALKVLETDPFSAHGQAKRIFAERFRNLYRTRIADYRLIYCVGDGCVAALSIGHRKDIYDRFAPPDLTTVAGPSAEPIAIPPAYGVAPIADAPSVPDPEPTPAPVVEEPLPLPDRTPGFFRQLLSQWGVPADTHDAILACQSIDELIELGLPDEIVERVLHWSAPPPVTTIIEQPTLDVPSIDAIERYLEGTLRGFLLKLDPEQQKVAYRVARGAQLVKGGPGSGKSLVALYHIRHRIASATGQPPRALFVTYTRALTRYSRQLLQDLLGERADRVTVDTLDAIVRRVITDSGGEYRPASTEQRRTALRAARQTTPPPTPPAAKALWERLSDDYLLDEFEWIIEGRQLATLEAYLQEPREGRAIAFPGAVRRAVWELHRAYVQRLSAQGLASFTALRAQAAAALRRRPSILQYDLVVVDEAQDLPPVALAFCAELCATPDGLYVLADANQSIYGRGYSWTRAHDALNFRGRTTVLRRNYRSTRQIAEAAVALLPGAAADADGLVAQAVREGPPPILATCANRTDHAQTIARAIQQAATELRLPTHAAAVLARGEQLGQEIAADLTKCGVPARCFTGDQLDLDAKFVKVLTMHSAKGLEFPIVAVPLVDEGRIPYLHGVTDPDAQRERVEDERRLLFVALTRAMRRLIVTTTASKRSPLLANATAAHWQL